MKCPSCKGPKTAAHYLCRGCWFSLTRPARAALNRRDNRAHIRLGDLYRQIQDGVPLAEVVIA